MNIKCIILTLLAASAGYLFADQTTGQTSANDQAAAQAKAHMPKPFQVVNRAANSRLWKRESTLTLAGGKSVTLVHQFEEIASGMCYQNAQGEWVESQELIEPFAGGSIARQGQYNVVFANNLNSAGSIDLRAADGKRLRSNILGLIYRDTATGDAVIIAKIQDSTGTLIANNQVLYLDAFEGVKADVRYTYKRGSFEQDVIVREQLPTPESCGLNSDTTELEVMTEFLNLTQESIKERRESQGSDVDQDIAWGTTYIGRGRAFSLDGPESGKPASVTKQLTEINGRKILLERVKLTDIQAGLNLLPRHAGLNPKRLKTAFNSLSLPNSPAGKSSKSPMMLADSAPSTGGYVLDYIALNASETNFCFRADMTYLVNGDDNLYGTTKIEGGTVIKFDTNNGCSLNVLGNLDCQTAAYWPAVFTSYNDSTVGESVGGSSYDNCTGTLSFHVQNDMGYDLVVYVYDDDGDYVVEGATVGATSTSDFSFTAGLGKHYSFYAYDTTYYGEYYGDFWPNLNNGTLVVDGGEVGYSDTGDSLCTVPTPSPTTALHLVNPAYVHDIRISNVGIGINSSSDYSVADAQFVNCGTAMQTESAEFYAGNILISRVGTAFYGQDFKGVCEQLTLDQASQVTDDLDGGSTISTLALTNSLLTAVGSYGVVPVTTNHVIKLSSGTGVYQVAGGGSYYLTNNSIYRNAGTVNIDPTLLDELATKTTYPPVIYSNTPVSGGVYPPVVPRNSGIPDLGWHYSPLDYCFGRANPTANITFSAGTAMGWFDLHATAGEPYYSYGLGLSNALSITCIGSVLAPCVQTRYSTVQEGNGNWTDVSPFSSEGVIGCVAGIGSAANNPSIAATINARFTLFSSHANQPGVGNANTSDLICRFTDCILNSGRASSYNLDLCLTNCLLLGTYIDSLCASSASACIYMQNCTMYEGAFGATRNSGATWPIKIQNSAFESVDFSDLTGKSDMANTNFNYCDYNAWITNQARFPVNGTNTLTLTNFNWQAGWLGGYYLTNTSPLINAGYGGADQWGLYHFTTQTNQIKETNSPVDIGYHSVAMDASGHAVDVNGDGIPDYLEDSNGNGLVDVGETNWAIAILTQPVGLIVNQGDTAIFSVVAAGLPLLHYQWYFHATNLLSGATNSTLFLSFVGTNNIGYYSVVVTNVTGAVTSSAAVLQMIPVVNFTNFCDVSTLQINGNANSASTPDGCVLQLTPGTGSQAGSAFLKTPIPLAAGASFSAFFSFRLSHGGGLTDVDGVQGADGITFTMETDANDVGTSGSGIGYHGITNSVAIEFDTWNNTEIQDGSVIDPTGDGNHVGIDYDGILHSAAFTHINQPMNNGNVWYAWVDYNAAISNIEVRVSETNSRPLAPTLTNTVSLLGHLKTNAVYIGFTAATGEAYNQQDVLSWRFVSPYNPIGASNNAFTVAIVSPINQSFAQLTLVPVSITTTSTVAGVTIRQVDLFGGLSVPATNFIGTAVSPSNGLYQIKWRPLVPGTNILIARATDSRGSNIWSSPVTNLIYAAPQVSFIAPTNTQIFLKDPTNLLLKALALADPSAAITKVVFYAGTNAVGTNAIGVANLYSFTNTFTNGSYTLRARAYDGNGGSAYSSNIVITVMTNSPPLIFPGTNLIVDLWQTNVAQLMGAVSDDGLPSGVLSTVWTYLGISNNLSIINSNQPDARVQFDGVGTYIFQLSANDSQFTVASNITVTVISNVPPLVYAGTNQVIFNISALQLHGAVVDDGQPFGTLVTSWNLISGPGTVTFANASLTNTIASFSEIGNYELKLTADDGRATSSSTVNILVSRRNAIDYQATNYLYTFDDPNNPLTNSFFEINFDDSSWTNGQAGFGNCTEPGDYNDGGIGVYNTNHVHTVWPGADFGVMTLLLRKHFYVPPGTTNLSFGFTVDNRAKVYIDGTLMTNFSSNVGEFNPDQMDYAHAGPPEYDDVVLANLDSSIWHEGDNILAVCVRDFDDAGGIGGATFFDCRMAVDANITPFSPDPTNTPPQVVVGQFNYWTTNSIDLEGSAYDDQYHQYVGQAEWSVVSGPGTVTFSSNSPSGDINTQGTNYYYTNIEVMASFSAPGNYVLRFAAWDEDFTNYADVTVNVASPGAATPLVSITSPTEGAIFPPGVAIAVQASASTSLGTITNINFLAFDGLSASVVGRGTSGASTIYWLPSKPGTYALLAEATDSYGRVAYSDQVNIQIKTNGIPVVGVAQNYLWTTNAVQLKGWAFDDGLPGSTNAVALWTNISGPGSVTFIPDPPVWALTNYVELDAAATFSATGTYVLRLLADDTEYGVSNDVTVVVASPTAAPPTVSLLSPVDGTAYANGLAVPLQATANATSGTITNVDYYALTTAGSTFIGHATSSPFGVSWHPPLAGSYGLQAVATDSGGRVGRSVSITVSVTSASPPVANRDYFTVFADSHGNILNVLTNDYDTTGYPLRIVSANHANNGGSAIPVNGGTAISYTPAHGASITDPTTGTVYSGDSFTYVISDGHGGTAQATVDLGIIVPTAPQVSIVSPSDGATFAAGTVVPLISLVTPSTFITNVDYFLGAAALGMVTNGGGGLYTNLWVATAKDCDCGFTATAYDSFGQIGTSPAIHLHVTPPHNGPGGLSSVGPMAAFDSFVAGTNVPMPLTNLVTIRDGMIKVFGQAFHPLGSNDLAWQVGVYSQDGETLLRDLTPKPLNGEGYHANPVGAGGVAGILVTNADLTTLQNGVYTLRLVAEGGYMMTNTDVQFILDSNLKLGQFSFSQQDLVIPVNGIPLTVTRTYNSLNPDQGDFGYSWTYTLSDMDVQLDESRMDVTIGGDTVNTDDDDIGSEPAETVSVRAPGGWFDVTLTLPDGRRTTFYASFVPDSSDDSGSLQNLVWTAEPGVTATLTTPNPSTGDGVPGDNTLVAIPFEDFAPYWQGGGEGSTFDNYDLPGWVLTTQDGTKYHITRGETRHIQYEDPTTPGAFPLATVRGQPVLTQIEERSGEVINISPAGLQYISPSSATRQIVFQRNADGRIAAITDPNGSSASSPPAVKYEYDGYGNLLYVERLTDSSGTGNYVTNTFLYGNANFPHYITDIFNADGTQVAKNFYDDSGKLTAVQDADGNITHFIHDQEHNMEVTLDRRGYTNTLVYDTRGNVTCQTNQAGEVMTMGYDVNNNKTNQLAFLNGAPYATTGYAYDANNLLLGSTDPLGHTNGFVYDQYGNALVSTDAKGVGVTNVYDTSTGELLSTTDALGDTTTSMYSGGLLVSSTDALGTISANSYNSTTEYLTGTMIRDAVGNILSTNSFTYDDNGNRLTSTVWRQVNGVWTGATTTYVYDSLNRVVQTIDPDGGISTVVYDANGKQQATIDKLGHTTTYAYDAQSRLIQTTYPDLTTEKTVYDANGNPVQSIDRAGRITAYVYDGLSRVVQTIYADNTTNTTVYDQLGRVARTVDARGTVTATAYDVAGRRIATTNAVGATEQMITHYVYDANGNQISMTDALVHSTANVYDALNRQVQVMYADGTSTGTGLDALGRRISTTNQDGVVTMFGYDGAGRLTMVTNAVGTAQQVVTQYRYDEAGNQLTQVDGLGRTNTYIYDDMGRRIRHRLPGGQSEGMAYDLQGNVLYTTNFNGAVITNRYDVMNRVTNVLSAAGYWVSYAYLPTGQRQSMTDVSGYTTYGYDNRDRLLSKQVNWTNGPSVTLSYGYDVAGMLTNITSSTVNGGNMAYEYDGLNRLTNVLASGSLAATYGYDSVGNLQAIRYGNGVTNQFQYDMLNRLTNEVWKLNATALARFYYQSGSTGNRTNLSEAVNGTSRTCGWNYDALYRLTNEIVGSSSQAGTLGYGYDPVGNRTNRTVVNVAGSLVLTNQTPAYNTNDWLTVDSYDNNGNTTVSTGGSYHYDALNHLTNANDSVFITYDGDGNRMSKTVGGTTTYYVVDDRNPSGYAQVVEEWTVSSGTTNVTRVYSYGLNLISQQQFDPLTRLPSAKSYYGYDGHGSVRFFLNTSGAITDTYTYDAYGTLIHLSGTTANNYLYCAEQYDVDLGLYYNLARYLNVGTGRFGTMDSYEGANEDPLGLHKYLYGADNPVDNVDPSGNAAFSLADSAAIGKQVHKIIGDDFYSRPGMVNYLGQSIYTILGKAGPGGRLVGRVFPDLVDFAHKEIYEIKPVSFKGTASGAIQLAAYIALFNKLDPSGGWTVGSAAHYTYSKDVIPLGMPPSLVVVAPPLLGMIFYEAFTPTQLGKAGTRLVARFDNARLQQMVGVASILATIGGI